MTRRINRRRRGGEKYITIATTLSEGKLKRLSKLVERDPDRFINRSAAVEAGIDLLLEKLEE